MEAKENDPVAIVTGAASGIGKAIALLFAKSGYGVLLVDCDEAKLEAVAEKEFSSFAVGYHKGDVSVPAEVRAGLAECLSRFGRVDVLVCNAAAPIDLRPLLEMSEEQWDRTMSVNLKGVFLWGQAVANWMVNQKRPGRIINIACQRAELAAPNRAAYIASKGGVKMLTKAMAVELAPHGINVNAIEPGRTVTEGLGSTFGEGEKRRTLERLVPWGRLATPDDIASVALFLASDGARYMTGAMIPVDGGYTCSKD